MRGKLGTYPKPKGNHGITPADAGKTFIARTKCKSARDHPRGCGENTFCSRWTGYSGGSPPRMRGKPAWSWAQAVRAWITPADAGKTNTLVGCSLPSEDHPRGCGENQPLLHYFLQGVGSPPRMRGKLYNALNSPEVRRITPADAGKTMNVNMIAHLK